MRWNATRRPPASTTAALILMLSWRALSIAPAMMRLASSSVRLIASSRGCAGRIMAERAAVSQPAPDLGHAATAPGVQGAERRAASDLDLAAEFDDAVGRDAEELGRVEREIGQHDE